MTMRRTDNGFGPAPPQAQRVPADQLLPELALYEQLIGEGVADAHARGSPVDHVTARRLAIWLAARPQEPSFTRGPRSLSQNRGQRLPGRLTRRPR